jgi:hypothetical protein
MRLNDKKKLIAPKHIIQNDFGNFTWDLTAVVEAILRERG